ncbi:MULTISPECIES: ABC transporter permease [Inquilinus]|uniref:Iron(III) transport system permease protein n=1 Tax=Inquilinus ginsengisoli TaxID=363840 RepID=A0ABU1JJD1_9PROT|nr:iron ABC transporter permease [Inquilinus ginsengisoli]MDR6288432.1 iron(III) transport system permease protein [Inquilinus ginsengisoli]
MTVSATAPVLKTEDHPAGYAAMRRRRRGLMLPLALGLLLTVLVLVPIALMFVGAVRTGTFVDPRAQFSLRSLAAVYTTLPYLKTLAVTVGASLLVSLVACVIGIALAWLLARTDLPAKGVMENAVIAPLYLSPFVGALAWLILASPNAGLLNVLARDLLGVTGSMINVMTASGVILVMALYNVPYAYMTVSAALKGMDPSMEEASYLNGAGTLATAWKVTFPVVRPSIISAFFFVFVLTCGTFSIPAALGGTQAMPFLAVDIYRAVATFPLDYSRAAAIGTLLFWISLIGVFFYRFASRVATRFVTVTARGYRTRMVKLRGWRLPAILMILVYVTLAIILPYLALLYVAFTSFTSSSILDATFTLANFWSVAGSVAVRQSIGNTLLVGLLAPTLCVLLGIVIAYAVRRLHVRGSGILDYIAMFPIAVPGIVFGTGIFWTYLMTPAYGTIWILVIAFVASYIPFAYRMIDTSIIQIDKSLEEASAVCGASHWRTARQVTFKLIRPGVLSAWILVFIFSIREISAAILLASPSNKVLSVMSWDYLEFGNVQNAAIIGLLQTAILVAGIVVGRYVLRVRLSQAV